MGVGGCKGQGIARRGGGGYISVEVHGTIESRPTKALKVLKKICGTYSTHGKFRGNYQNLCGKLRGQFETQNFPHQIIQPENAVSSCKDRSPQGVNNTDHCEKRESACCTSGLDHKPEIRDSQHVC